MGNFFDDFDAEDFAFWGGFIQTQLEGEKEEKQPDEPLSFEDMLKTGNEIFDNKEYEEDYDLNHDLNEEY